MTTYTLKTMRVGVTPNYSLIIDGIEQDNGTYARLTDAIRSHAKPDDKVYFVDIMGGVTEYDGQKWIDNYDRQKLNRELERKSAHRTLSEAE